MSTLILPDGSRRPAPDGGTVAELIKSAAPQLASESVAAKVNGEIGKGFGFRTQIGGITLKGISLGGKRKKVGLEERSDFGVRTASVADPATRMCGGMRA